MDLIKPSRRGLLLGLGTSLIAAPAIVRFANIMPVRALKTWPIQCMFQDRFFWIEDTERGIIRCTPPLDVGDWLPDGILRHELMTREQIGERFGDILSTN
jgi:hypothetical protein